MLFAKIFLKIKNKRTDIKEGKKQYPKKRLNVSEEKILFKKILI